MEAINLTQAFEENHDVSEEKLMLLVEIESLEKPLDYDSMPINSFRGFIVGGFFSLLLWAIIFCIIM